MGLNPSVKADKIACLGIWKDVRLEATGPARIDWTQVQTELQDNPRRAWIQVKLEIDSREAIPVRADFRIRGHATNASAPAIAHLNKGENIIAAEFALPNPLLWWPNGQGDQPLYELETQLIEAVSGRVLDATATRFGVRAIRWEQVQGAPPDFINPFQLLVNGRPVRQMGSNLIPPDALFGRIGARGPRLLQLAKADGINTLRVWGGGVILPDSLYDLADELGIQDANPAHLAFPATAQFDLPPGILKAGQNRLEVQVGQNGWFTGDALDWIVAE